MRELRTESELRPENIEAELPVRRSYARLRELSPEQAQRTIFITGGAFTDTSRKFLETTDNDRLEKPFDRGKLDAILARYVN